MKFVVGLEHVRRYDRCDIFGQHFLDRRVTEQTSREGFSFEVKTDRFNELPDLSFELLFSEIDAVDPCRAFRKRTVGREQDATLPATKIEQVVIGDVGEVGGVVSENAKPAGKHPEHTVSRESWLFGHYKPVIP